MKNWRSICTLMELTKSNFASGIGYSKRVSRDIRILYDFDRKSPKAWIIDIEFCESVYKEAFELDDSEAL